MIVKFQKEYLSELYYEGKCKDKKHRYQPTIVKRYKQRIDILNDASCIEALYQLHSLGYEVLTGNKEGYNLINGNEGQITDYTFKNQNEILRYSMYEYIELLNNNTVL